jgi:hypothetical protein
MKTSEFVVICQHCKDFWIGNDIEKCETCGHKSLQITHPSNRQFAKNLPKIDWEINKDIDELIDRLQYFKNFIIQNVKDDDVKFFKQSNTVHTDIQILSQKLKYK